MENFPVAFGGRGRELDALNAWLNDSPGGNNTNDLISGDAGSNNLLITAPAGRGKTALLVRWIQQLDTDWSLVFVPVSIRAGTNREVIFYQAFAERLAEILGEPLPGPRADPAAYYKDKVIELLDRVGKGNKKCLVVIDGLDEARGWDMNTTVLPVGKNSLLKIVISARELAGDKGSENWRERLGWIPPLSDSLTLRVQRLSREGIADVLAKMEFPVAPLSKEVNIIDELYRLTDEGDPLVLHFYAIDLLKRGNEVARLKPEDLRKLEPGFGAYLRRWLDDQKREWQSMGFAFDESLIDAILAVLAIAHGPLKLPELEEMVKLINSRERIFTVDTIKPLNRFIVGDGTQNGYALAHPKLASFLQRDYFAGSKVLQETREAFVNWMREIVLSLNSGNRKPEDTPAYALLFYTQHLALIPRSSSLPYYRELVENGWRKAWEKEEGGFHGFSRDIEVARRAFQEAADKNIDELKKPQTGLGALLRCSLCLSSIRSLGAGATGDTLAEFLHSRMITPKQALYLAQLKEEKKRAEAIGAIIEMLSPELKLEAMASAMDIHSHKERFNVLMLVAPHLSGIEHTNTLKSAFNAARLISDNTDRLGAIRELLRLKLPEGLLSELKELEEDEVEKSATRNDTGKDSNTSSSQVTDDVNTKYDDFWRLEREALAPGLSDEKVKEIFERAVGFADYYFSQIFTILAPHISKELQEFALTILGLKNNNLYFAEMFAALLPNLGDHYLERAARLIVEKPRYDMEKSLAVLIGRLSSDGIGNLLQLVLNMNSEYDRTKALVTITPLLTREQLDILLNWTLTLEGYYAKRTIEVLIPYLPDETIMSMAAKANAENQVAILVAYAPTMDPGMLPEAAKMAMQITDMEQRGIVLAKLLPGLRKAGLTSTITEAYLAAFIIGDSSYRLFTQAILIQYAGGDHTEIFAESLQQELKQTVAGNDIVNLFFYVMSLTMMSQRLDSTESAVMLEQAIAEMRNSPEPSSRIIGLSVLSGYLPAEKRAVLLKEVKEFALSEKEIISPLIIFISLFYPPAEITAFLQLVNEKAVLEQDEESKKIAGIFTNVLNMLMSQHATKVKQLKLAEELKGLDEDPDDEQIILIRFLTSFLVLLFSEKLPDVELQQLIDEILSAISQLENIQTQGFFMTLLASYLPTPLLWDNFNKMLDAAENSPRAAVLTGLAFLQGLEGMFFKRNSLLGRNRIPGSPLTRLGGPTVTKETIEAIRDVCSWWP